jgi:hypothetical protein
MVIESIDKAVQCAELLVEDIREAHSESCRSNHYLEILLLDLITDAMAIRNRLNRIQACGGDYE